MERLVNILNELKVLAVTLIIVTAVWTYARAQNLEQQANQIRYWPSVAPPAPPDGDAVADSDPSPALD